MTTIHIERATAGPRAGRERRWLGGLAAFAAVYTYALIVFGGIVRITGSGMGCGDDWPRCNGRWIPEFTFETIIEYTHRLLAAGIGLVVLAVFLYAIRNRNREGVGGTGGALRPLGIAAALLVAQVVLGAVTVRLELPTSVTVAHFITAMLFMAMLVVAAARCGTLGDGSAYASGSVAPRMTARINAAVARGASRQAIIAAVLTLLLVAFGALTANTPAAPQACRGFPLCSGELLPPPDFAPAHLQWTHRLLAFVLFFQVLWAAVSAARAGVPRAVRRAATIAALAITVQLAVAAALVTLPLPWELQAAHLAVGAAVWFVVVAWAAIAHPRATIT
jgi:heme A synthase